MPDYIYFLESRLSAEQRAVVLRMQELAAEAVANVYLVGGAIRDLICGSPIRDLDFTIEGNPTRFARELEKGGARIVSEDDHLRHVEMIFSGDVDGSIAAARDNVYHRPGTRPEYRWSTIMEDLRRRDFSINAIALSLNPASRGLLLDPTNGLADLEKREVRALSIHSFTNQPIRLLRVHRYAARMDFKIESRTQEWFDLAMERSLHEQIPPEGVAEEIRQLARDDRPAATLKRWENANLISAIHPQLARRHPDYDALARLMRVRENLMAAGLRPRLFAPATAAFLGRLKQREKSAALHRMGFRSAEIDHVLHLDVEAQKIVKMLAGRKTAAPVDALTFLEKVPLDLIAHILAESSNSKAVSKVKNFLFKWKPIKNNLPTAMSELETIGMPRGPKFDKVIQQFFEKQLEGKARLPEERIKLLRKLSGIKEPKKAPEKEEKSKEKKKKHAADHFAKTRAGKQEASKPVAPGAKRPASASKKPSSAVALEAPSTKKSPAGAAPPAAPASSAKQSTAPASKSAAPASSGKKSAAKPAPKTHSSAPPRHKPKPSPEKLKKHR